MATFQVRKRLKRQKTDAVKFRITDQGLAGQPVKLVGISLEYGLKTGLKRTPQASGND